MWRNADRRSDDVDCETGVGKRALLSIYGSKIFGESRLLAPGPFACQFHRNQSITSESRCFYTALRFRFHGVASYYLLMN